MQKLYLFLGIWEAYAITLARKGSWSIGIPQGLD